LSPAQYGELAMTWVDYAILAICLASAAFGFWRGFAHEAISIASWLAAIWLAWRFAFVIEPMLGEWVEAPELRVWAARTVLFVIVLALGGLVSWFVRALVRHTGLSGTDRMAGALFGLARGVLIVGLGAIAFELAGLSQDPWWQQSRFKPYSERVASGIRHYAELGSRYLESQGTAVGG
jgi:membrane protein required for colicin V production